MLISIKNIPVLKLEVKVCCQGLKTEEELVYNLPLKANAISIRSNTIVKLSNCEYYPMTLTGVVYAYH